MDRTSGVACIECIGKIRPVASAQVGSEHVLSSAGVFKYIAGDNRAGCKEPDRRACLPVGDDLPSGGAAEVYFALVLIGPAVVVKNVVIYGDRFTCQDVQTSAAGAKVAVLKGNRAFIPLDLQCGLHVTRERGIVDGDVFVTGIEPQAFALDCCKRSGPER